MNKTSKRVIAVTGSAMMVVAGTGSAMMMAPGIASADDSAIMKSAESENQGTIKEPIVEGVFSFTQTVVSPLEAIFKNLGNAAKHICGSDYTNSEASGLDAASWTIAVGGSVENPYILTTDELFTEEDAETLLMGCACSSNPTGGIASVNAEVTGIPVTKILRDAAPLAGANTVVFTSADGYQIALPLDYLKQRYCPIVFDINGSPLINSVGGVNQLWLGSTAGHYFARDIVEISVEIRETPPPVPGTEEAGDSYANVPNVGIHFGGEVE